MGTAAGRPQTPARMTMDPVALHVAATAWVQHHRPRRLGHQLLGLALLSIVQRHQKISKPKLKVHQEPSHGLLRVGIYKGSAASVQKPALTYGADLSNGTWTCRNPMAVSTATCTSPFRTNPIVARTAIAIQAQLAAAQRWTSLRITVDASSKQNGMRMHLEVTSLGMAVQAGCQEALCT